MPQNSKIVEAYSKRDAVGDRFLSRLSVSAKSTAICKFGTVFPFSATHNNTVKGVEFFFVFQIKVFNFEDYIEPFFQVG